MSDHPLSKVEVLFVRTGVVVELPVFIVAIYKTVLLVDVVEKVERRR